MYIEPFWCGVIATLLTEVVICVVLIAANIKTTLDAEEDETNEE